MEVRVTCVGIVISIKNFDKNVRAGDREEGTELETNNQGVIQLKERNNHLSKELAGGTGERRVNLQALHKSGGSYELHLRGEIRRK